MVTERNVEVLQWAWNAKDDEQKARHCPWWPSDPCIVLGLLGGMHAFLFTDQGTTYLSPSELHSIITSTLRDARKQCANVTHQAPLASAQKERQGIRSNSSSPNKAFFCWGVAESSTGKIVTNWIPAEGRVAGLFWWKKNYETEVRHVFEIERSMDTPQRAGFAVTTEVRERPNPSWPWTPGDPELGRTSLQQLQWRILEPVRNLLASRIRSEVAK
jgi:hypothetical protein